MKWESIWAIKQKDFLFHSMSHLLLESNIQHEKEENIEEKEKICLFIEQRRNNKGRYLLRAKNGPLSKFNFVCQILSDSVPELYFYQNYTIWCIPYCTQLDLVIPVFSM